MDDLDDVFLASSRGSRYPFLNSIAGDEGSLRPPSPLGNLEEDDEIESLEDYELRKNGTVSKLIPLSPPASSRSNP
jgi:hypothetical protein